MFEETYFEDVKNHESKLYSVISLQIVILIFIVGEVKKTLFGHCPRNINLFCISVQDKHTPVSAGAANVAAENTSAIDSLAPQNAISTAVNGY